MAGDILHPFPLLRQRQQLIARLLCQLKERSLIGVMDQKSGILKQRKSRLRNGASHRDADVVLDQFDLCFGCGKRKFGEINTELIGDRRSRLNEQAFDIRQCRVASANAGSGLYPLTQGIEPLHFLAREVFAGPLAGNKFLIDSLHVRFLGDQRGVSLAVGAGPQVDLHSIGLTQHFTQSTSRCI